MRNLQAFDRGQATLDSELLSSVTSGSFTLSDATILGSQTWVSATGEQAILTLEDEQILGTIAVSGSDVTFTIASGGRGFNGTTAATHSAEITGYFRMTAMHHETLKDEIILHQGGIVSVALNPTISSATVLSVAGVDVTSIYTVGRILYVKVSGTWHRCVVRSSSFSTNTTINVSSDTLPSSGTVQDFGIGLSGNEVLGALDYQLVKNATNIPASNPPSGYSWIVNKGGQWYTIDSSGVYRFLGKVVASVSSSSGTIVLDGAVANVFDTTLTENITTVTLQNFVDGHVYIWRVKQHASAAKTISNPAGFRFGTTITGWTMTSTTGKTDHIALMYNSGASKYDILAIAQGY